MKKAIFTDIDNTILPKGHTKPSLKTIQTFKKALDLGYEVFLISGRPIKYVEYLAKSIDDRVKAIGFNGNYSDIILKLLKVDNSLLTNDSTLDGITAKEGEYVIKYMFDMSSNREKEMENLIKEKEALEASIKRRNNLLANQNYVSKAPLAIVNKEREDLEKEKERLDIILSKFTK